MYMMEIAYTANYKTQAELRRAYARLNHTPRPGPSWGATLLVNPGLTLEWACPVLVPPLREDDPPVYGWHVIARAGELDWPPLKLEKEIWPALLEKEPVPTGPQAEAQAEMLGQTVEEMHYDNLRRHYLGDAHLIGSKRNPRDVNFDPRVRDWDHTARELAEFADTHRPPLLTPEQRVMAQGVRKARLEAELAGVTEGLGRLMRNAARDGRGQNGRLRRGLKSDLSRWAGVTRPTVDAWLSAASHCEGDVPEEDTADAAE